MSSIAVWLLVLACGWILYRRFLPTKAIAIRNGGHPQYFGAALGAAYIALLALFLNAACVRVDLYRRVVHEIINIAPDSDAFTGNTQQREGAHPGLIIGQLSVMPGGHFQQTATVPAQTTQKDTNSPYFVMVAVGLWAIMLAMVLPLVLNLPFSINERLRELLAQRTGSRIERFLLNVLNRGKSVAFTLTTGKVYVGVPLEVDPQGEESEWIAIRPLASGQRIDGDLKLTVSYEDAYEAIGGEGGYVTKEDFVVTLPIQYIVTVQNFDLMFYARNFKVDGSGGSDGTSEGGRGYEVSEAINGVDDEMQDAFKDRLFRTDTLDRWCRVLNLVFYLMVTACVIAAPLSVMFSAIFGSCAIASLYFLREPVSEKLADLIESLKTA